jgi:hypothetical protein
MSEENFYVEKMISKSDDELKNYIENRDHFQEDAVLAAILELEKRGLKIEGSEKLKQELSDFKNNEEDTINNPPEFQSNNSNVVPELYSKKFIFIFGVLFSVFGGGVLMALNFLTLNNKKAARITILASITYSVSLVFLFEVIGTTNPIISILSSILGIYLLDQYVWKKENPEPIKHIEKGTLKPIIIGLLIAIPITYLLIISGNLKP